MIEIPSHIEELQSYKPGRPVSEIVASNGLTKWAVLWNNENNNGPSKRVKEAILEAYSEINLYPDPSAIKLRKKLAELYGCYVDNILVDNGSESLLDNIFRTFLREDDELLTCEGSFVSVYVFAKANHRQIKKIPLGRGYGFDVILLTENITAKTKAIYICNPNNPTGTIISRDDLSRLLEHLPSHVLLIMDEAYFEYAIAISDKYPDSFSLRHNQIIVLRTFSKAYALAGMRVGYALGPVRLIEAMNKVKMTFAPSVIAQAAALGAMEDREHMLQAVKTNTETLPKFYNALHNAEIEYVPSYANYVMADLQTAERASAFVKSMLENGVFVRHLPAFGLPHCVRISTGLAEENDLFFESLGITTFR